MNLVPLKDQESFKVKTPLSLLHFDIKNVIMFQYLDIKDIGTLYRTHKLFHCLTEKQIEIMEDVHKGIIHIMKNGKLDTLKWLYNSDSTLDLIKIPNPSYSKDMPEYAMDFIPEYLNALELCSDLEMIHWIKNSCKKE